MFRWDGFKHKMSWTKPKSKPKAPPPAAPRQEFLIGTLDDPRPIEERIILCLGVPDFKIGERLPPLKSTTVALPIPPGDCPHQNT